MNDSHKKAFWTMMNVTMELTNHPPLSKEAVLVWCHKLSQFEYKDVEKALDKWLDSSNRPPAPSDIAQLCKPLEPVYQALGKKVNREANKEYASNVVEFVAKQIKPTRDYKKWAKDILADPSKCTDYAVRCAREALGNNASV